MVFIVANNLHTFWAIFIAESPEVSTWVKFRNIFDNMIMISVSFS